MANTSEYEYKILVLQTRIIRQQKAVGDWEKKLSELGKEGWELISVIPIHAQLGLAGSTPQVRCFLKRKI